MKSIARICLLLCTLVGTGAAAQELDLYDPSVLRTLNIEFHDANWLQLLRNYYDTGTYILADLEVDGIEYPDVGVRIRGNTSYTQLPSGSEKFSLKVKVDHTHEDQELLGYKTLNLNNGFHDPTFTREIVYNNYVARFIPNIRANHVVVTLNGSNWGVYNNVQQGNKRMLRDYFDDGEGLRITCSNNPNGPGLAYAGPNASSYSQYEIDDDGGLADPYASLIAVTYALSNEPLASWQNIDALFAIDPAIWSVVLENMLTDDDSYVNKGCDFATYTDPSDGRMHLIQRDANESFTATNWAFDKNFNATNKPVLSRVLSVPELRQRYLAHYRTVLADLNWETFGPLFEAQRDLIDAAVQADPKKLYSYEAFQQNFTTSVNIGGGGGGGGGPGGGTVIGIKQFIDGRESYLAARAELVAQGPAIDNVAASAEHPAPSETVWITASVTANGNPVSGVLLHYRPDLSAPWQHTAMADDGASGDGGAGDGVYGVVLPVAATAGQHVPYYVEAIAQNSYASRSYEPALAERGPLELRYGYDIAVESPMRITEYMYSGQAGEFVEFTNVSDAPVDMTGWSFDDSNALPGAFDLSAFGAVLPGQSVILTESDAETFRADWGLAPDVPIIGDLGLDSGNNLGRSDSILLFNAASELVDRLDYGDQDYPGTIRTQNASGQPPCAAAGANDIALWQLSVVGDAFGSHAAASGDIGTPGGYNACETDNDTIFADGFD